MPIVAIHSVRTAKGFPPKPVGVWTVDDDQCLPYYPTGNEHFIGRAEKALNLRPKMVRLEDWLFYKAKSSPSWRIYEADILLIDETIDPSEVFANVHSEHAATVAMMKAWALHERLLNAESDSANEHTVAGWGSNRFVVSESWWIASELVRRHPELIAYEMHPAGGSSDVLCVTHPESVSPGGAPHPRVMLNRAGTIQVHHGDRDEIVGTWNDAFATATPHTMIKTIEKFFSGPPDKAPTTTPRALAYRFIATALSISVNDRHPWDARCEFVDSSGWDEPRAGYLNGFPAAAEALRSTPEIGIWGEPQSHFWALLRGQDPVAIVSIEGTLYLPTGKPIDLMKTYLEHDRRIIPMTARLLKAWL